MTESEKEYFSVMYENHSAAVYGVCLMYLKNKADAEEAVSESFVRLMENMPVLQNDAHAKAYLLRTAVNICKNSLKSSWRRQVVHDEDVMAYMTSPEEKSIMEEVLALPPKYRVIIYMHYYAGYTSREIADIMGLTQSAVLSRLSRGRQKLKDILTEGGILYVQ